MVSLHLSTENHPIEMNLAMRILSSTCILVLVAASCVVAQTSPKSVGKATAVTPLPKAAAPAQPRSAPPVAAVTTTSRGGELSPSQYSLRNSATAQPANNQSLSPRPVKKTSPVKMVQKVTVHWMSLEQALEKSKLEKRKIFVDVYTDWCGWCKHMDSTTFLNPAVASYLNDHYYAVKFNAEQTQDIFFKDKVYRFQKNGSRGYHELAALWLNNRLSFPTVVVLDENLTLIQPVPGYQDAGKMEAIINYFGSDSHRRVPWETYEKAFTPHH
jgi:thioredoxin-related protein